MEQTGGVRGVEQAMEAGDWSGSSLRLSSCHPELAPLISGKECRSAAFPALPLPWASEVIITTAQEGPRESLSQLLEKLFLVTAEGRGRTDLTVRGSLDPPPIS